MKSRCLEVDLGVILMLTCPNRTDRIGDIDGVIATILDATRSALKGYLTSDTDSVEPSRSAYLETCFRSVWIGLAGLDRAGLQGLLVPRLMKAFGIIDPKNLRLTDDVDLLTAAVPSCHAKSSVLVLIAGTGSIAMRYSWSEDQQGYVRVARSGGWGHILGDEGGGYAIGLKAIQHALGVFEDIGLGLYKSDSDELAMAVSAKLGCHLPAIAGIDMLNDLLAENYAQSVKVRIAGVAEVVLALMNKNKSAAGIVNSQVAKLVGDTLRRLVDPRALEYQAPETSVLILAGGLMNNERYRAAFEHQLDSHRLYFRGTVVAKDAATLGAGYLSR